jgi:hypothetical protein
MWKKKFLISLVARFEPDIPLNLESMPTKKRINKYIYIFSVIRGALHGVQESGLSRHL